VPASCCETSTPGVERANRMTGLTGGWLDLGWFRQRYADPSM
jgi:hypothetical protein